MAIFSSHPLAQQPERLASLWGNERLGAAPLGLVVEALLDLKQTVIFVCVGHQLAALVTVEVLVVDQELDEGLFLDSELQSIPPWAA